MTDTSFHSADQFSRVTAGSEQRSAFNPISIVAISAGLWGAASATLLWAGLSWGWALGLGYLASPVLTIAVILLACLLSDLGAARTRRAERGLDRLNRDVARAATVAEWDADCAAERSAGRCASDRAA